MRNTRSSTRKQRIQDAACKTRDALFAALSPVQTSFRTSTPSPLLSLPPQGIATTPTVKSNTPDFSTPPTIASLEPKASDRSCSQSNNFIKTPEENTPSNPVQPISTSVPATHFPVRITSSDPDQESSTYLPADHPPVTNYDSPTSSTASSVAPTKKEYKTLATSVDILNQCQRTCDTDIDFLRAASTSQGNQLTSIQDTNGRIAKIMDTILDN